MARNIKASKRGWGYDYANSRLTAYVDGAAVFHLNDAVGTQGLANPFLSIGDSTTSVDVTLTDHVIGFATWLKVVNSASKSLLGAYFKVETDGTNAATDSQIVGCAMRCTLDQNISSAYSTQSHLTLSAGATIAQEAYAGSFYLNATGSWTAPNLGALLAILSGNAAKTNITRYNVARFVASGAANIHAILQLFTDSVSSAEQAIFFDLNGTVTDLFKFDGSVPAGWTTGTGEITFSNAYIKIPIKVDSTQYYMVASAF